MLQKSSKIDEYKSDFYKKKQIPFLRYSVIERGLSYFHKITQVIMKINFLKRVSNIIECIGYKILSNDVHRIELQQSILK